MRFADLSRLQFVKEISEVFSWLKVTKGIPPDFHIEMYLALDRSKSMIKEYEYGCMSAIIDAFLGIVLSSNYAQLLHMYFFNGHIKRYPDASTIDAGLYLHNHAITVYGSTNLSPVVDKLLGQPRFFEKFIRKIFRIPCTLRHVTVVTDGDCFDRREFELLLARAPSTRRFMHIIGVSKRIDVEYLKFVARNYPNVAFDHFEDVSSIDPILLCNTLLNDKFINWLKRNNHI